MEMDGWMDGIVWEASSLVHSEEEEERVANEGREYKKNKRGFLVVGFSHYQ